MILADLIKDDDGHVPELSTHMHDWTQWIAWNADASTIPTEARFFRDYPEDKRDWYEEPISESGRAKEMDWGYEPDWYWWYRHWRGYIPCLDSDTGGNDSDPWWIRPGSGIPFNASNDNLRFLVERRAAKEIQEDFGKADNLVFETSVLYPFRDHPYGTPTNFSIFEFTDSPYNSLEALQRAGTAAKRAILDRVGWLRWWRAVVGLEDVKAKMSDALFSQFLQLTDPVYKSRGYIFNLPRDWTEINIPFLLQQGVPIHYIWGPEESIEPHLSKFNPKVIALDESDGRIVLEDWEEDEGTRAAAEHTKLYDDYCQPRNPPQTASHLSFESDTIFYVIDFMRWKRRRLPDEIDSSAYALRFHFTVNQELGESRPTVTFWRWKKKSISLLERADTTWTRGIDFYKESTLRELYKFGYAPGHGKTYDISTGLEEETDGDDSLLDTPRPFNDQAMSSPDGSEAEDGEDEDEERQDRQTVVVDNGNSIIPTNNVLVSRPLLERLLYTPIAPSPYVESTSSITTVTSWRNVGRQVEEDEGIPPPPMMPRAGRPRSRSPRRTLAGHISPYHRPVVLFRRSLRELGSKLTYHRQISTLPNPRAWNPDLLSNGVLMLPDKRAEVRLRYFANCNRDVRNIRDILRIAIEHRMAFRIAVRKEDLPKFAPTEPLRRADRVAYDSLYSKDYTEPPLTLTTIEALIVIYASRITEFLRRPHASSVVGLGGACSWLAEHWGGIEIIYRYMKGPSVQTTIFNSGASDIQSQNPQDLYWDEVSAQDIALLFGNIPNFKDRRHDLWLYPPPHFLEAFCHHWSGEWNATLDGIFEYISEGYIAKPATLSPMGRSGWKDWLRSYNRGPYRPVYRLQNEDVTNIFKGIVLAGLPPTWDRTPLADINIPESVD